jgi:hypothetical protein
MLQLFSETANAALPAVVAVGPEANPAMAQPPT